MSKNLEVKITANTKILKYNENQNPSVDEPFEVDEKEIVLKGDEAKQLLNMLGGMKSGAN